jgi:hypothetical protein
MSRTSGADFQVDAVIVDGTNSKESIRVAGEAFGASVLGLAAQVSITWTKPGLDRLTANALAGDDVRTGSPGLRRGTTPGFGFDPCVNGRVIDPRLNRRSLDRFDPRFNVRFFDPRFIPGF